MNLAEMLDKAVKANASDIFIVSGQRFCAKIEGNLVPLGEDMILPPVSEQLVMELYNMAKRSIKRLEETGDDDLSISVSGLARLRVSTYKQRNSYAAVIRVISFGIPDYKKMRIPDSIMSLSDTKKGLILVTGTAGSGKSTTLACIIDRINKTRSGHIITLEDPIEYLYKNDKCVVSQREVSLDTESYLTALRACLRQSPDVVLLGEMRDYETIKIALTAAETGHLVLSTLHTLGAVNTIDRIIDIFPSEQQGQIRIQLAALLRTVVSQQLVQTVNGDIMPVFEVMKVNNAIRNLIREAKAHQIDSLIATSSAEGMISMDNSLLDLYKQGLISEDTAKYSALSFDMISKKIDMEGAKRRL